MTTSNKNSKFDCLYCPHNKDVQIATANFFKHILTNHLDVFLCGTTKIAEHNRNVLKHATKYNPVELRVSSATYYCCLKCNRAAAKESMCRICHFNVDDPTKNHGVEHLQGCKNLLQKVRDRMEELKDTPETKPIEEPPTESAVKIVYKEKIVEKIVYKDRDRDLGLSDDKKDSLTDILFEFNSIVESGKISNKVAEILIKDVIEYQRKIIVKDIIISKLSKDVQAGAKFDPQKFIEWSEEADANVESNEKIVRDKINTYIETIKDDISTEPDWMEHSEALKKLGIYDDMKMLIKP